MFGNNKPSNSNGSSSVPANIKGSNSLVAGTSLEGTLNASTDIRIDGSLTGTLNCKGRVVIGPSGSIDGQVNCKNAVIEGTFTGNLQVVEVLHVKESAKVNGDISTGKLLVQVGAIFNVNCNMGGQKIKSKSEKPNVEHQSK